MGRLIEMRIQEEMDSCVPIGSSIYVYVYVYIRFNLDQGETMWFYSNFPVAALTHKTI